MPRVYYMSQSVGILLGMMGEHTVSETLHKPHYNDNREIGHDEYHVFETEN